MKLYTFGRKPTSEQIAAIEQYLARPQFHPRRRADGSFEIVRSNPRTEILIEVNPTCKGILQVGTMVQA